MDKGFVIKVKRKMYRIPLDHISFMESKERKTIVHTRKGSIAYYGKIKDAELQLDERFMCCHKSYIFNMDEITSIEEGKIIVRDSAEERTIYLGRDSSRKAIKCYKEYVKKRT